MIFWLLLMILQLQMPLTESKAQTIICTMADFLQVPFKYYQFGDQIIGAIGSLFVDVFVETAFRGYPKMEVNGEHM